jgi:hypothetical protein
MFVIKVFLGLRKQINNTSNFVLKKKKDFTRRKSQIPDLVIPRKWGANSITWRAIRGRQRRLPT